jgi:hypothetical protein
MEDGGGASCKIPARCYDGGRLHMARPPLTRQIHAIEDDLALA